MSSRRPSRNDAADQLLPRTTADIAGYRCDVAVIGGGVIGHGIAWEASRSGRSVVLIDDAPGSGASWAAAGMLAPVSELHYQEEALLELMLESSACGRISPRRSTPVPPARMHRRVPATSRRRPSPSVPTPPTAARSRTCGKSSRPAAWPWSR